MKQIIDFVEQKLKHEPTGHDYLHAMRVYHNAMMLLTDDLDRDVVLASALVHDLIDSKLEDKYRSSFAEITQQLLGAGLSPGQVKHVFDIIQNISFSQGGVPTTIEGKIVQDADRLDALGAIGIARAFSYGGKQNRLIYDPDTTNGDDTLSHFYQKLFHLTDLMNTKQGKEEAEKRTEFMRVFVNTLYDDIKKETI